MRDVNFFEGVFQSLTSGRGQLRLILQPLFAIIVGVPLGAADARAGKAPFLMRLWRGSEKRSDVFRDSLSDVLIPLCAGSVVDGILQYLTVGYVRPVQAVFVAFLLVWLPYSIARGIANRLMRGKMRDRRRAHLRSASAAAHRAPER